MRLGARKNSASQPISQSELNTNRSRENNDMNSSSRNTSLALRNIRIICSTIFVAGIAGMIIASIAGNNVGLVNTIGGTTAISALVLLVATISANTTRPEVFDDAAAERLELKIAALAKSGADEKELRELVRQATQLGETTRRRS
jgi:hypothetical protein